MIILRHRAIHVCLLAFLMIRVGLVMLHFTTVDSPSFIISFYKIIAPSTGKIDERLNWSPEERLVGKSDSWQHYQIAANLVNHGMPYFDIEAPGNYIVQPGYGFFLSAFVALRIGLMGILLTQAVIALGTASMTADLAFRIFGSKKISCITVLASALFLPLAWIETTVWAESLYTFLITLFIYLFYLGHQNQSKVLLLVLSLSIGAACLVRPIITLFPFFVCGSTALVSILNNNKALIKWSLKTFVFSSLGILLFMLPWSAKVYMDTGVIVWGTGGSKHGKMSNYILTSEADYVKKDRQETNKAFTQKTQNNNIVIKILNYITTAPNRFNRLWLNINNWHDASIKSVLISILVLLLWLFALIGLMKLIISKNIISVVAIFFLVFYISVIHQILGQSFRYAIPGFYQLFSIAFFGISIIVCHIKNRPVISKILCLFKRLI